MNTAAEATNEGGETGAMPTSGVAVIKTQLKTLPNGPGVYRMLNARGDALYVGKANSLRRRVTSYTQLGRLSQSGCSAW